MTGDEELARMLRRAMADRADAVEPAGDGLRRIRERTRRPARARWRVPALALTATAALIAAVFVLPGTLRTPDPAPGRSAAATPPSSTPIPGAGVNDLVTIWPYASRATGYAEAEAATAAGIQPDLSRPDVVALTFLRSYAGTGRGLTAVSAGRWKAGLRMQVRRGGVPVSLVYLVRVRVGDDAPYVVVDATAPGLTLTSRPGAAGTLAVDGTVTADLGTPTVQLRRPGVDRPVATARPTVAGTGWAAEFPAPAGDPRAPVEAVAAWTADAGGVTAFAAAPADRG